MPFAKEPLTIVLCLDHAFVSGGQAKVAFDSAIGLKQAGHRPIVFAAAGPVDDALTAAVVEIVCLGQRDLLGIRRGSPQQCRGLGTGQQRTSSRGCSAVCRQSARSSTCMAGRRRCRPRLRCRSRGPVCRRSIRSTNIFSSARTAASTITSAAARAAWNRFRPPAGRRMRFPELRHYIAISRFQVDVVGERLPAGSRLHLVSNPIDVPDLGPKPSPARGDIIFVGRISAEKGPLLFAEAARRAGIVPVYIGDGPAASELQAKYPEARLLG
jgi:hypothetical protein